MASEVASNYSDCFAYLLNEFDDEVAPGIKQELKDRFFADYSSASVGGEGGGGRIKVNVGAGADMDSDIDTDAKVED